MRNIWRIFRDDLRFASSTIASVLVMLMACLIPVLFTWFSVAGNWAPYGNIGQLKVAVANCDEGHESDLIPVRVNAGDRVIDELRKSDSYGWVFVDQEEALDGVRSGEYYAAIVIPEDFSSKMVTVFASETDKASIQYYLNLKHDPVASVLAGAGGAEVLEDVSDKFTDAVDVIALGLADDLLTFIDSGKMQNFGAQLAVRLDTVADDLDATAEQVRSFASLADAASSLTSTSAQALKGTGVATDASQNVVSDLASQIEEAVGMAQTAVASIRSQVSESQASLGSVGDTAASELASDAASLASTVSVVEQDANEVADALKQAVETLAGRTGSLASSLDGSRDALSVAANQLGASASKVRKFRDDIARALSRGSTSQIAGIVGSNSASLAEWLATPVDIEKHEVYAVENYGSSMTAPFTLLALWAGALLAAMFMKMEVSQERVRRYEEECGRPLKNYELYLGRSLMFLALSLVQATVIFLGNVLFLQVQCAHPLLLLVMCWACALVFSATVYALVASFGALGKAICVIALALQLTGLAGGYPLQMMPDYFQVAYRFTPFAQGMQGMQAAMAGFSGAEYLLSLLLLLAFLVPALVLGLGLRGPISRFMQRCSQKVKATGLM